MCMSVRGFNQDRSAKDEGSHRRLLVSSLLLLLLQLLLLVMPVSLAPVLENRYE